MMHFVLDSDLTGAANQASSDGGLILSCELVCSVDCPTLPLTPIPDDSD